MRGILESVTYSMKGLQYPEVEKLFLEKTKLPQEQALFGLVWFYAAGREYRDAYLVEASSKLLRLRYPDLEQRLPWYDAMYDVINKSEFQAAGWGSHYLLNPADEQKVKQELMERAQLSSADADLRLEKLLKHLAFRPGKVLQSNDDYLHGDKPKRLATICLHLHTPWGKIAKTAELGTIAERHYDIIKERLQEQKIEGEENGKAYRERAEKT